MNEVIKMTRKAVTAAVVAATIAWSVSLSAFLAPLAAQAATAGSLVKASLPAVYYVGQDGKRYVFPNEKTYKTWYADFSSVMTITDAELAAMSIGGNVTYKPGVKMVKITTDPKVYAVDAHGTLRGISSEAVASGLYGTNWNQQIDDVPDAFFTNYTVGADITAASQFSPSSASAAATSINQDKNLGSATTVSGTLSAMLSSGQPAGGTVPKGSMGVNVLKVDVHNGGSSAMSLDSLTAHRSGAGSPADIANIYVYAGNDRLTTGRTINSSTNDASFSGLNLSLAAGETKTLWLSVDFSGSATPSDVNMFSLTSLLSGSSTASGLPLSGPSFTIAGATAGSLAVINSGTITNPKSGQTAAKVAQFTLQAGSSEDLTLQRIALYQSGNLSSDKISNLALKQAGLTIATVSSLNKKDLAVFILSSPLTIAKGDSRVFEVYADIAGSARSGDTLKWYIDQTSDILATGNTYGFGVIVNIDNCGGVCAPGPNGSYDGTAGSSSSSIDAGQLTVTFNGPSSKDVAANSKNVELFNFTMAAQSNLEVKKLHLLLNGDGANALDDGSGNSRLTNIQVVDTATGAAVMGPKDANQGTGYTAGDLSSKLDFTEVFDMTAGQSRTFKVTANIANTTTLGALSKAKVTLGIVTPTNQLFSAGDIRNLDTSTNLDVTADIVPSSSIGGNNVNLKAPTLALGVASTPVAQTYIKGTQNAQLMGITLKAGDGASVKVNTIKVTGLIDTNNGTATCSVAPNGAFTQGRENAACSSVADVAQTLKLWNGSTQIGQTKSPTSSASAGMGGEATFDNLNLTVPAGQTLTVVLSTNLSSAMSNLPDDIRFSVTDSDITATDVDGNTVNASGGTVYGAIMRVADTGALTVTKAPDDTESEAGLVVGGSSNVVLAKYKFAAQNEELKLTKARFNVNTPNAVSSLSLYDGSTLVGGPVSVDGSGNADFSGMSAFVVPKDGNKTLTVKGNMNSVGTSGAATGSDAIVALTDDSGTFEARGTSAGSSTVLDETQVPSISGWLYANSKLVRRTKPTISIVALPTTTLVSGDDVVLRFTVSADAADNVALKGLTAQINNGTLGGTVTNINNGDSALRRVGDASNLAGTSALTSCAAPGACTLVMRLSTEEVVAAGTSRTYEVRANVTGITTGDSVTAKLLGDASSGTGLLTAGDTTHAFTAGGTLSSFVWSDNSDTSTGDGNPAHDYTVGASSQDWMNGQFVKVLPTDSQTLSK